VSASELAMLDFEENPHLFSYACRLNILTMIKCAGSGHIGSSLSAIDLVLASRSFLKGIGDRNNLFFSSKGHDAPAIYAASHAFGEIPDEKIFQLRRLGGLPGHPETHIVNVPTNTGSLGMGVSKGKGFIYASRNKGENDPVVIVLLGDGELQEGQIWESLPGAARDKMDSLLVVVDGNKIQSDTWVDRVLPLGNLEMRVKGSGWNYLECDGHDISGFIRCLNDAVSTSGPTFLYAHTVKSSGIPFMADFATDSLYYQFHSGAPSDKDYVAAVEFLREILESETRENVLRDQSRQRSSKGIPMGNLPKLRQESLIQHWNSLLISACERDERTMILDADLSYDTGTYGILEKFPKQYLQCGIAEQDMVSTAGTIALAGSLPIVHSFASFLTTRSLEQIFNNTTEETKIIYAGFLAGIVPTAPGHSHQAILDVGAMNSIPGMLIYEPACTKELTAVFERAQSDSGPSYIRINSIGIVQPLSEVQPNSTLSLRRGGERIAIVTSGVTMTQIALEVASQRDIAVFTRPYINSPLTSTDVDILSAYSAILVLENYSQCTANFFEISRALEGIETSCFRHGITEIPKNGETNEVLQYHYLDSVSVGIIVDSLAT
jgi:transketolase